MQRMTKTQIEYATSRVNNIAAKRVDVYRKENTTGTPLTDERMAALLRQGKVKLQKGLVKVSTHYRLAQIFDFSPFGEKVDEKRISAFREKLSRESTEIIDKFVLGDSDEAMALIEKFAKT